MAKKETIGYTICVVILLWIIASTVEVWIHNAHITENYSKANLWVLMTAHTTDMVVVGCEGNRNDDYIVTVKDIEGNLYAYIDSTIKANGDVIRITISGNEIINAR